MQTWLSSQFSAVRQSTASASDARVKTMSEVLGAVRLIKCQAWEGQYTVRT